MKQRSGIKDTVNQ